MAGNENSGKNVLFPWKEEELDRKIEEYKGRVRSGEIARASWPHFCAELGCTEEEVRAVINCIKGGAYQGRATSLKRMATWIRGQMMSAPGWNGQLTSRAIFALKQDIGDGVRWTDTEGKNSQPVQVEILFGGNDKRGKNAAK